ncbi:hypothetical protein BD289DRAFT_256685 [Coniella lustricola]|uniref:Uncharacterized protein n=1 Tax=Coniella lustricola TaxID=2025994 RepID=A0A2T3AKT6_9PEZI|nr:hypothetical protein BD289DRAFT_256685 [Coniella lustricola]
MLRYRETETEGMSATVEGGKFEARPAGTEAAAAAAAAAESARWCGWALGPGKSYYCWNSRPGSRYSLFVAVKSGVTPPCQIGARGWYCAPGRAFGSQGALSNSRDLASGHDGTAFCLCLSAFAASVSHGRGGELRLDAAGFSDGGRGEVSRLAGSGTHAPRTKGTFDRGKEQPAGC